MRRLGLLLLAVFLMAALPGLAWARELEIAGPWLLEYPQGKGMLILTKTGDTYTGSLNIPKPKSGGSYAYNVKMLTHRSYLLPGNNITFDCDGSGAYFFLNLSSETTGVGWLNTGPGAEGNAELVSLNGLKVQAHR
ncbi:MAG: hypothetical protein N2315_02385 [Thermanaerothrix sp.]|nr:hypothetical protein [Thermanaerothrix sp.]